MRVPVLALAMTSLLAACLSAAPIPIIQVSGFAETQPLIYADQALAVSWVKTTPSTGWVNIKADLQSTSFLGGDIGSAYLTKRIGVGTTLADVLFSTPIAPSQDRGFLTVFEGVRLGPGTYYLVFGAADENEFGWGASSSPIVTTELGTTRGNEYIAMGADVNSTFAPASNFTPLDMGLVYDVAVPEPASMIMLSTGAALMFLLRRRRA